MVRKLLVFVLSFALLHAPVGHVFAQMPSSAPAPPIHDTAEENKSMAKKLEGNSGEGKGTLMLNISMFLVAMAMPVVFKSCSQKISSWIFLGAGAYMLAMEIFNSRKHKKQRELKKDIFEREGDKQVSALETAAEQTEDAAKQASKRSNNFMIAGLGFMTASAAALVEAFMEPPGACAGEATPGEGAVELLGGGGDESFIDLNTPPTPLDVLFSFSFSPAEAFVNPGKLLIPGIGGAAGYLMMTKFPGVKRVLDSALNNGYTRAAIFGGFGGLALLASTATKGGADELKGRAKRYRKLARDVRRKTTGTGGIANRRAKNVQYIDPARGQLVNKKKKGSKKGAGLCFTGKRGSWPQPNEGCSCRGSGTCRKSGMPNIGKSALAGYDHGGAIAAATRTVNAGASDLYNGRDAAARFSADHLGRQVAAVRKGIRRTELMANKHRKKLGLKPINTERMGRKAMAKLKRLAVADYKKLSAKDRRAMAAASPGLFGPSSQATSAYSDGAAGKKIRAGKGKSNPLTMVRGRSGRSSSMGVGDFLDDGQEQEKPPEEEEPAQAAWDEEAGIGNGDIGKKEGASLWETVSRRYILKHADLLKP